MKPAPFKYLAPNSLAEALDMIAEHGDDAKLLAGGQSIVPAMNFRLMEPSLLIDLNRVSELSYVKKEGNGEFRIGAMTRQRKLEFDPVIAESLPLLREAIPSIAHPQIRNRGTLGGSLVHADPAAELPVIITTLNGRMRLRTVGGERWVKAKDFYQGILTTVTTPYEILDEIAIPPLAPNSGSCFMEFARRKGDYALVGVSILLSMDNAGLFQAARIVYLNAGDTPMVASQAAELLIGESPSGSLFESVAAHAVSHEISPMANIHASVPYLEHLARVLTRRALNKATERIKIAQQ